MKIKSLLLSCTTLCTLTLCLLSVPGCPNSGVHEEPSLQDGGIQDRPAPLSCTKSTLCIFVNTPSIRSCEFMLQHPSSIRFERIQFNKGWLGRSKQADTYTATALIQQHDQAWLSEQAVLILKAVQPSQVKLIQSNCYDRLGRRISKPKVSMRSPS